MTQAYDGGDKDLAQNLYSTILPEATKIFGQQPPPQLNDQIMQHLRTIAGAADPQTKKDLINVTPGSTLIDPATGKPVYSAPAAAPNLQPIATSDGYSNYNPKTGAFTPAYYAGGLTQPQTEDPMTALINSANARVKAGEDPNVVEADITKQAQAIPGADVQLAQGGSAPPAGVGGRVMPKPPKEAADGALQQRITLARQMGATDDQIRSMVIGSSRDGAPPSVPGDESKNGDEYLKSLDPQRATQVRALADGRMEFPKGTALKSSYWQEMLSAVSQYDPNFDAVNYNARSGTRKAFTSGKEAATVNSLNTVAEHLGTLSDSAQKLNNTSFRPYNAFKNHLADVTGDPDISDFETRKKAAADEVAKVWRASGGSQADIEENLSNLSESKSPQQLNAAIGALTQLIAGKVAALNDQYTSGMGTTANVRPLVSPEARKAFQKTLDRAGMKDEHGLVGDGVGDQSSAPSSLPQGWKVTVKN